MTAEFDTLAAMAATTSSSHRDRPEGDLGAPMIVNDVPDPMARRTTKQILVAGIGNAWLRDDGFGPEVAKVLLEGKMPDGVTVLDFGSGGLDLAYEVMRGYDALVLLDVSKQGGEPGTLYVMEPDEESVPGAIDDGDVINPHGMDPQTMLRFVKSVGAWPGKVVVIACEPADVEEMGWGLTDQVKQAVDRAIDLVVETIKELQAGVVVQPAE
jgi:hydrogenase maturation protease